MIWIEKIDKLDNDSSIEIKSIISKYADAMVEIGIILKYGQSDSEKLTLIQGIKNKFEDVDYHATKAESQELISYSEDLSKSNEDVN